MIVIWLVALFLVFFVLLLLDEKLESCLLHNLLKAFVLVLIHLLEKFADVCSILGLSLQSDHLLADCFRLSSVKYITHVNYLAAATAP